MRLNIFVCSLAICILSFISLAHLFMGLFDFLWSVFEFFVCYRYWSYVGYILGKDFLPLWKMSLPLTISFTEENTFNFINSLLSIIGIISWETESYSVFACLYLQMFSLLFPLTVSGLLFRSLFYMGLLLWKVTDILE